MFLSRNVAVKLDIKMVSENLMRERLARSHKTIFPLGDNSRPNLVAIKIFGNRQNEKHSKAVQRNCALSVRWQDARGIHRLATSRTLPATRDSFKADTVDGFLAQGLYTLRNNTHSLLGAHQSFYAKVSEKTSQRVPFMSKKQVKP